MLWHQIIYPPFWTCRNTFIIIFIFIIKLIIYLEINAIISCPVIFISSYVEHVFALVSINHSSLLIGSTYLPPCSSLPVIESYLSTIDHLLITDTPNTVIRLGHWHVKCLIVFWWIWNFRIWDLTPVFALIVNSFSFLNLFQFNHIIHNLGNILDFVLFSFNKLSAAKAISLLIN